jgi:hypothetical protein
MNLRHFALACVSAWLLAACVPDPNESLDGSGARADTHDLTFNNHKFRIFTAATLDASIADARDWADGFEKAIAPSRGTPARAIIPRFDASTGIVNPDYVRAESIVNPLWAQYLKRYPSLIAPLPAPVVILIQDDEVNAFAVYDSRPGNEFIPVAFFIQTGALRPVQGRPAPTAAGLGGLIGHELAHLVRQHVWPGVGPTRDVHITAKNGDSLAGRQEDDPSLKPAYDLWVDLAGDVGDYPLAQLNGVPVLSQGGLGMVFNAAFTDVVGRPNAPQVCGQAALAYAGLQLVIGLALDPVSNTLNLPSDTLTDLNQLTASLVTEATQCAAAVTNPPTFLDVLEKFTGEDAAHTIADLKGDDDVSAQINNPNALDAIFKVGQSKIAKLSALAVDPANDFKNLRVRTTEEEADDDAMEVTHAIYFASNNANQNFDSHGLAAFLYSEGMDTSSQAACKSKYLDPRPMVPPPYGPLSDPHHATCYRLYHIKKYHDLIYEPWLVNQPLRGVIAPPVQPVQPISPLLGAVQPAAAPALALSPASVGPAKPAPLWRNSPKVFTRVPRIHSSAHDTPAVRSARVRSALKSVVGSDGSHPIASPLLR